MIEIVRISNTHLEKPVEVECFGWHKRLRTIYANAEYNLFPLKSAWLGEEVKWMEYSR